MSGLVIYHFQRAFSNLRYSLLINVITVATMTVALVLLAGYLFVLHNVNSWIKVSEEQFTIRVYLQDDLNQSQIGQLMSQFNQLAPVRTVEFVNKEAAKQHFLEKYPDFQTIVGGMTQNPFQNIFILKLRDGQNTETKNLITFLQKQAGVETVDYGGSWLERYIAIKGGLRILSYVFGSLILLACIFLVSNTIRLNIFTRKDEIEIFKLVGGTKTFIAMPFMIEGIILGSAAGVLAVGSLYALYYLVVAGDHQELQFLTGGLRLSFIDIKGVLAILAFSVFTGFLGSVLSLRRFLRYH